MCKSVQSVRNVAGARRFTTLVRKRGNCSAFLNSNDSSLGNFPSDSNFGGDSEHGLLSSMRQKGKMKAQL